MRRWQHIVILAALLLPMLSGGAWAAPPANSVTPLAIDPKARALMDQMLASYRALTAYTGIMTVPAAGSFGTANLRATIELRRPNLAAVSTEEGHDVLRAIADGSHLHVLLPQGENRYRKQPSAPGEAAIESAIRQGSTAGTALARLIAGRSPLEAQADLLKSLSVGEPETTDGVPVDVVVAVLQQPDAEETVRFAIGQQDHLLRQMSITRIIGGRSFTRTESHINVHINPALPQSLFVYQAPASLPDSRTTRTATTNRASNPSFLIPSSVNAPRSVSQPSGVPPQTAGNEVEAQRYDFGQASILDTNRIEHNFTFKNTGSAPLTIQRLSASCGCTSVIAGPQDKTPAARGGAAGTTPYPTLAPGEETGVQIAVDLLPLRPGALHKTVAVYAEGSPSPVARYEITGTLLPTVTFSPPLLDFGRTNAGESRPITLTATLDARLIAAGALPPLNATHPAIRIQPSPEDKNGATSPDAKTIVRTYVVSLAPNAPLGPITAQLAFSGVMTAPGTVASALARVSVPVTGQVVGSVTAQPQAVAFGAVASGQTAVRQIVLTGATTAALKNRKITSDSNWLTIGTSTTADASGQANSETVAVSLSPQTPAGVLQTQITVTLKNGQQLLLPVSAFVSATAKP